MAQGTLPPYEHTDLWKRAADVWLAGRTEVRWVKAHLTWEQAQARGFTYEEWAGNRKADEMACAGASEHAIDPGVAARVYAAHSKTERAQRWMAKALCLAADRGPPRRGPTRRTRSDRRARGPRVQRQPRGPPGDHGAVHAEEFGWHCADCDRRVKFSRGWRAWRSVPCSRKRRTVPRQGPARGRGAAQGERIPHNLVSEGGRTWCTRCGRSSLTRWRAKIGIWCARPPEAVDVPAPPVPVAPRPARASRAVVKARLETHLLAPVGDWLCCQRPGCGRRVRPREKARLGACLSWAPEHAAGVSEAPEPAAGTAAE